MNERFEHLRVERDGVSLHATALGAGRPVVLVHGFPQHGFMWRDAMKRLAADGCRAIALDQRGMGGSDIPPSGYDKETLAHDLLALLDAEGIRSASLVGYDHGGGTVLAAAYEAPERVAKLAVLEYAPPGFGYEVGLTAAPGNVNWQLAFFTQPDVAITFLQGKERELLAWYFWHWAHDPEAISQADFEVYVRQLQKPGGLRGGFMHFASVFEDQKKFQAWAARKKLEMPVLAVGGARGSAGYPEMALRALATNVRGAVLPNAGHWLIEEQPEALHEQLRAFLAE